MVATRTNRRENAVDGIEDGQVPFLVEELFFSRTDERGRIKAGNDVFQRVSQFDWDEMIDRPHNIVRHPTMPRAVFQILWDRIRAGLPVGAYVKNAAKDGRHYWVFAVVTPLEHGYLSVRLKPTSRLLPIVSDIYSQVISHEDAAKCKPSESVELLLEHLRCLGHHDYATFQAAALDTEMAARDTALSREESPDIHCFRRLASSACKLREAATKVVATSQDYRFAPLNLRAQASALGDDGKAIGVISDNYSMLSETIGNNLGALHSAAEEVAATMADGLFLAAAATLQEEMADDFGERSEESGTLTDQAIRYRSQSAAKLQDIGAKAKEFFRTTDEMRRFASALAAVRVMGTVENATSGTRAFEDLIADLSAFQKSISSGLESIWRINNGIRSDIELLAAQSAT